MKKEITRTNKNSKLTLAKTKKILDTTKKILSSQKLTSIEDYINQEMKPFKNKIDQNDMRILEQIMPEIIAPLFDSIDKHDLDLWLMNLQNPNNKDSVESLIGGCLILALCQYSELSIDSAEVSISRLSEIFIKIINRINDLS